MPWPLSHAPPSSPPPGWVSSLLAEVEARADGADHLELLVWALAGCTVVGALLTALILLVCWLRERSNQKSADAQRTERREQLQGSLQALPTRLRDILATAANQKKSDLLRAYVNGGLAKKSSDGTSEADNSSSSTNNSGGDGAGNECCSTPPTRASILRIKPPSTPTASLDQRLAGFGSDTSSIDGSSSNGGGAGGSHAGGAGAGAPACEYVLVSLGSTGMGSLLERSDVVLPPHLPVVFSHPHPTSCWDDAPSRSSSIPMSRSSSMGSITDLTGRGQGQGRSPRSPPGRGGRSPTKAGTSPIKAGGGGANPISPRSARPPRRPSHEERGFIDFAIGVATSPSPGAGSPGSRGKKQLTQQRRLSLPPISPRELV